MGCHLQQMIGHLTIYAELREWAYPPDGVLIEGKVARCVNKEITFSDVWVGLCETVSSFPYICMQSDVRLSKARRRRTLSASRDNPKDIQRVLRAGELR